MRRFLRGKQSGEHVAMSAALPLQPTSTAPAGSCTETGARRPLVSRSNPQEALRVLLRNLVLVCVGDRRVLEEGPRIRQAHDWVVDRPQDAVHPDHLYAQLQLPVVEDAAR